MSDNRRNKYQFCLFEYNEDTNNSAATKAVLDCNKLFLKAGYKDYTVIFKNNSRRDTRFYLKAFGKLMKFLWGIKRGSLVGIQYPMLNNVFKYFITIGKLKGIKFFCIIHDIESLRLGGKDLPAVKKEAENFNYYDALIVHNVFMQHWLRVHGVTSKLIPLKVFDYLAEPAVRINEGFEGLEKTPDLRKIVYAGNLSKSSFIYKLGQLTSWSFNVYGPHYKQTLEPHNVNWNGVFSPDDIVYKLNGAFGLIWDGDEIDKCDEVMGNYLKYNNPHKFSLYLAAGLPVIAPSGSAIGTLIKEQRLGFLVDRLTDLDNVNVSQLEYDEYCLNSRKLGERIRKGEFFVEALRNVEQVIGTA